MKKFALFLTLFVVSVFSVGCQPQTAEEPPVLETETYLRFIHLQSKENQPSLCALIQHEEKTVLIDGGWDEAQSKYYLIGYLHAIGVKKIDYLISTHAHADHTGGLAEVINRFDVEKLYLCHTNVWVIGPPSILQIDIDAYENMLSAAQSKVNSDGSKVTVCTPAVEGMRVTLDEETYFDIYNCTDLQGDNYVGQEVNHLSLQIHFVSGSASALIGGDALNSSDCYLLGNVGEVDVYGVQHHGTAFPYSSAELLQELKPKYSVASGPSWAVDGDTRARCEQYGEFYVTGESGTLVFAKKDGAFVPAWKGVSD